MRSNTKARRCLWWSLEAFEMSVRVAAIFRKFWNFPFWFLSRSMCPSARCFSAAYLSQTSSSLRSVLAKWSPASSRAHLLIIKLEKSYQVNWRFRLFHRTTSRVNDLDDDSEMMQVRSESGAEAQCWLTDKKCIWFWLVMDKIMTLRVTHSFVAGSSWSVESVWACSHWLVHIQKAVFDHSLFSVVTAERKTISLWAFMFVLCARTLHKSQRSATSEEWALVF